MNITNLEYFVAAAQELNISKAAKKLYITQQSLSSHIARLEEELGAKLFDRSHGLKLTYAGECTLRIAKEMLALNNLMVVQLDDIENQRRGVLRLGVGIRAKGYIILPKVLPRFHTLYPNVDLQLDVARNPDLREKLYAGDLDVLIGPRSKTRLPSNISDHVLYTEPFCLIVPQKVMKMLFPANTAAVVRSFSRGMNASDLTAFADAPFLLREPGQIIREEASSLFSKAGIQPPVVLECVDTETIVSLCVSGMGCTFAYELTVSENSYISNNSVYVFPINEEGTAGDIMVYYHNDRYLSKATRDFLQIIREEFHLASF